MTSLPTTVTSARSIPNHVAHHIELHRLHNRVDGLAIIYPETYGWTAVEDGGSAITADNLALLLTAVVTNKGARITGGAGKTYRCDLQINLPTDGAAPPKQYPIVFAGAGTNKMGQSSAIYGGTVLDLRYPGSNHSSGTNPDGGTSVNYNDAKIVGIGLGVLDFDGVTLTDNGTSSAPFLHTTYTTVQTSDLAVFGNPSKSLTTCDQDFWIAGGQTNTPGTPTGSGVDEPFQGYGSVISRVYCNRIRRLLLGQVYFNANVIRDNYRPRIGNGCPDRTACAIPCPSGGYRAVQIVNVSRDVPVVNLT